MAKNIFILITIAVFFYSCSETAYEIPKPCTEDHNLPFEYVDLKLVSDTTSDSRVNLSRNGYIDGRDIAVKYNSFNGTAIIWGTICSERKMSLDITFESPNDMHTMRIVAEMPYSSITGQILYCVKINNECNYISIGHIIGYMSNEFNGYYYVDEPYYQGSFNMIFYP